MKDLLGSDIPLNIELEYQKTMLENVSRVLELKEEAQNSKRSSDFRAFKHAVESLAQLMLCSQKFYQPLTDKSARKKRFTAKPVEALIGKVKEAEKLEDIEELLTELFEKLAKANIFVRVSDDGESHYFAER